MKPLALALGAFPFLSPKSGLITPIFVPLLLKKLASNRGLYIIEIPVFCGISLGDLLLEHSNQTLAKCINHYGNS